MLYAYNMPLIDDSEWANTANSYRDYPANSFARMLHYCAMEGFEAHTTTIEKAFGSSPDTGSQMLAETYVEYLVLFLHLVTRKIDEIYGSRNVAKFQKLLLPHVTKNAQAYFEGSIATVAQQLAAIANGRERDYAKCEYWVPEKPDWI